MSTMQDIDCSEDESWVNTEIQKCLDELDEKDLDELHDTKSTEEEHSELKNLSESEFNSRDDVHVDEGPALIKDYGRLWSSRMERFQNEINECEILLKEAEVDEHEEKLKQLANERGMSVKELRQHLITLIEEPDDADDAEIKKTNEVTESSKRCLPEIPINAKELDVNLNEISHKQDDEKFENKALHIDLTELNEGESNEEINKEIEMFNSEINKLHRAQQLRESARQQLVEQTVEREIEEKSEEDRLRIQFEFEIEKRQLALMHEEQAKLLNEEIERKKASYDKSLKKCQRDIDQLSERISDMRRLAEQETQVKVRADNKKRNEAAICIQAIYRGFRTRRTYKEEIRMFAEKARDAITLKRLTEINKRLAMIQLEKLNEGESSAVQDMHTVYPNQSKESNNYHNKENSEEHGDRDGKKEINKNKTIKHKSLQSKNSSKSKAFSSQNETVSVALNNELNRAALHEDSLPSVYDRNSAELPNSYDLLLQNQSSIASEKNDNTASTSVSITSRQNHKKTVDYDNLTPGNEIKATSSNSMMHTKVSENKLKSEDIAIKPDISSEKAIFKSNSAQEKISDKDNDIERGKLTLESKINTQKPNATMKEKNVDKEKSSNRENIKSSTKLDSLHEMKSSDSSKSILHHADTIPNEGRIKEFLMKETTRIFSQSSKSVNNSAEKSLNSAECLLNADIPVIESKTTNKAITKPPNFNSAGQKYTVNNSTTSDGKQVNSENKSNNNKESEEKLKDYNTKLSEFSSESSAFNDGISTVNNLIEQRKEEWKKDCTHWSKPKKENSKSDAKLKLYTSQRSDINLEGIEPLPIQHLLDASNHDSLQKITTLELINLSQCPISSLSQCHLLKCLTITDSEISKTLRLQDLVCLQYAVLKNNKLKVCYFNGCTSLMYLDISNNSLKFVEGGFLNCSSLCYLDLSHNQITRLGGLNSLSKLHTLNLSHNLLVSSAGIGDLASLQRLDLSYNQLQVLEGTINTLGLLRQLYLTGNSLISAPYLPNQVLLSEVELGDNDIVSLSGLMKSWLPCLTKLALYKNRLSSLDSFQCFPCLQNLNLSHNLISESDHLLNNLIHCFSLQSLSLEGNPLTVETDYRKCLLTKLPTLNILDNEFNTKKNQNDQLDSLSAWCKMCEEQVKEMETLDNSNHNRSSSCTSVSERCDILSEYYTLSHQVATEHRQVHETGNVCIPHPPKTFKDHVHVNINSAKSQRVASTHNKATPLVDYKPEALLTRSNDIKSEKSDQRENERTPVGRSSIISNNNSVLSDKSDKHRENDNVPSKTFSNNSLQKVYSGISRYPVLQSNEMKGPTNSARIESSAVKMEMKVKFAEAIRASNAHGSNIEDRTAKISQNIEDKKILMNNETVNPFNNTKLVNTAAYKNISTINQPQPFSGYMNSVNLNKFSDSKDQMLTRTETGNEENHDRISNSKNFHNLGVSSHFYKMKEVRDEDLEDLSEFNDILNCPNTRDDWRLSDLEVQQRSTVQAVDSHPEGGSHVRRFAWEQNSQKPPPFPSSRASNSTTSQSNVTRKEDLLSEEWGFKDSRTAELLLQRARRLERGSKKKFYDLDPNQRLALFRKQDSTVRPNHPTPNRRPNTRVEYFQAKRDGTLKTSRSSSLEREQKQQLTYEWVNSQQSDTESVTSNRLARGHSEGSLPRISPSIVSAAQFIPNETSNLTRNKSTDESSVASYLHRHEGSINSTNEIKHSSSRHGAGGLPPLPVSRHHGGFSPAGVTVDQRGLWKGQIYDKDGGWGGGKKYAKRK